MKKLRFITTIMLTLALVFVSAVAVFAAEDAEAPADEPKVEAPKPVAPGGPGEAAKNFADAYSALDAAKAFKYVSTDVLGKLKKQELSVVKMVKGLAEEQRAEPLKLLGIENSDLDLADDELLAKLVTAKWAAEKAKVEKAEKTWDKTVTVLEENIEDANATVKVKGADGVEFEVALVKKDGAWKVINFPGTCVSSEPKKIERKKKDMDDGYPATPGAVLKAYFECMEAGDGQGAVKFMSDAAIKKTVAQVKAQIKAAPQMAQMMGVSEDDLKGDDSTIMGKMLSASLKRMRESMEAAGQKLDLSIEILAEEISGDKATVKMKSDGMGAGEAKVKLIKENGKWKLVDM